MVHGTREIAHFNVTRCPTDAWAARQIREATSHGVGPKYFIRDNDDKFGKRLDAVAFGTGIEVVKIPLSSPCVNPIYEGFLGSVRRECLDHVVILRERQLHRGVREWR